MEGRLADEAQTRHYFSTLMGEDLQRAFAYELDKLCRTLGLDVRGAVGVRVAPPQAARSFVEVRAAQPGESLAVAWMPAKPTMPTHETKTRWEP